MQTLGYGSAGKRVEAWQYFLRGQCLYPYVVDGEFGHKTEQVTKAFQRKYGLKPDGLVGSKTYGQAMKLGFELVKFSGGGEGYGPSWPSPPLFKPLIQAEREKVFGSFAYKWAGKGEGIHVLDNWAEENIEGIRIPQLKGVKGVGRTQQFFHKLAVPKVLELFQAWDDAGLSKLVLTWGGSYAPRFVRGSRSTLSNHAFGTAFDINVAWNYLGTQPALAGEKGSVRDLVPIANELGWYWGGHWGPAYGGRRADGMHLELVKL